MSSIQETRPNLIVQEASVIELDETAARRLVVKTEGAIQSMRDEIVAAHVELEP